MKLVKHRGKTEGLAPAAGLWQPSWPLSRLQTQIDQLFNDSFDWFGPLASPMGYWGPAVDVVEDKHQFVVKVELPGMKREEMEIYLTGDALNIAGERKEESKTKTSDSLRSERRFGRFHRWVSLPEGIDSSKIEALYKDGVLTITCPKTQEPKRKQIDIKIT